MQFECNDLWYFPQAHIQIDQIQIFKEREVIRTIPGKPTKPKSLDNK